MDRGARDGRKLGDEALTELLLSLDLLRARLADLRLPLEGEQVPVQRQQAARAVAQFDDYLLPRVRASSAPLLVVVGGSTGAGKSTLVNSLLGERVTVPGVLRPTTRSPVLVHHPHDAHWFTGDRVLPGLSRDPSGGGQATLELVPSAALPAGMALIDAPDLDSVVEENRTLAVKLLAAADLWLFVTTAARYADAVPWDQLHEAARRHTQLALVLSRVDPGAEAVEADLLVMLSEQGLAEAPVFMIPEQLGGDGLLPEAAVGPLARWLSALGRDVGARTRVIEATRDGVVDDLIRRSRDLAMSVQGQNDSAAVLRTLCDAAFREAEDKVAAATSDGAMLRGEVLARWQDFVGTGEFFRAVEKRIGWARDTVTGFFRGRGKATPVPTQEAIGHSLEAVIVDSTQAATDRVYRAWHADPAGRGLIFGMDLSGSAVTLRPRVSAQIRQWQGDVLALVGEQAAGKRGLARAMSFGVNSLGVSLMIVVFASTGGLTGAEVGIAGGTAVLAQRLLEGVFGDEAVRQLTRTAHDQLVTRVTGLLDEEAAKFTCRLDDLGFPLDTAELLEVADLVSEAALTERRARADRPERISEPDETSGTLRGVNAWAGAPADAAGNLPGDSVATDRARDEPGRDSKATARPEKKRRTLGRLWGRRRVAENETEPGEDTSGAPTGPAKDAP